jgi:DNA-binding transcriptional LysR family regulator
MLCDDAQEGKVQFRTFPSPDDLLILLSVARLGRFTAVAEALETTHTTISRRILALDKKLGGRTLERTPHGWELTELGRQAVAAAEGVEQSLGNLAAGLERTSESLSGLIRISTPDVFGPMFVVPALVRLQRKHPLLRVEMMSANRRLSRNRSGVDLEIVTGAVEAGRSETIFLADYFLRLYASPNYLKQHGTPKTIPELQNHRFVSYVESALQIIEIGHRSQTLTEQPAAFQATSLFAQVEAVRHHSGIGLLPSFMVYGQPGFVPVLPNDFERKLSFWAAARPEALRSPSVRAVLGAVLAETNQRQDQLTS